MSELRDRMIRDMTLRGFSPRTHKSYLAAVIGLAKHYHRSPDQLTNDEVQAYLFHLIHTRKRAWASCSLAVNAFRFLFHGTLGRDRTAFHVPAPKQPQKLPEILSRAEVWRLIDSCVLPKHRLVLATTYGAGLRVSEVIALKVTDIDGERLTIPGGARQGWQGSLRPSGRPPARRTAAVLEARAARPLALPQSPRHAAD